MLIVVWSSPFGNQLLLDLGYYVRHSCYGGVDCVEYIWWRFCTCMLCSRIKRGGLLVFCISLIPVVVLWLVNSVICCSLFVFGYLLAYWDCVVDDERSICTAWWMSTKQYRCSICPVAELRGPPHQLTSSHNSWLELWCVWQRRELTNSHEFAFYQNSKVHQ
jgi:hypothetical protein